MNCDSEHGVVDHGYENGKNGYGVMTMNSWIVIMNSWIVTIYKLMVKIWRSITMNLITMESLSMMITMKVNYNEFNNNGIVVNGEKMKVNYNELNNNGIVVNGKKYSNYTKYT